MFAEIELVDMLAGKTLQKLMETKTVGFTLMGIVHQKKEQKIGDVTITTTQDFTILSVVATSRYQAA